MFDKFAVALFVDLFVRVCGVWGVTCHELFHKNKN